MAAGLLDYDWMMSYKERPWHGIGTVVDTAPTSAEAIKIAKLDWKVKQYPVYVNGEVVDNYFCNIRTDCNIQLGLVKGRYRIVQNEDAFDFVDDVVGNGKVECHYETAGSLFNGRKVFLLVRLADSELVEDKVENYLFFTNSHDGSSALTAGVSSIRVVCNNTLQLALRTAKRTWKCRHTENIESQKKQAQEALGFAVTYTQESQKLALEMAMQKIDEEKFFRQLFGSKALADISQQSKEKVVERIHIIYNEKDDLSNFRGTAWGIYNAVADYCSNSVPFRQTSTAAENKLDKFFIGNAILNKSQDILMAA